MNSIENCTDRAFFGHPRGLTHMFGVEVWERFSYYGMLVCLLLYLYYPATGTHPGLGLPRATATNLVGVYGGLVYISTIVGCWIADRVLGAERTLFYSAILVMIGHTALAVAPGLLGLGVGLICVALGSGGIKGNATAVIGTLYTDNDERRDAGFSIYYMGINIGALAGPLLAGITRSAFGFHCAFGMAAVGMALGLIQYAIGRRDLGAAAIVVPNPLTRSGRLFAGGTIVVIVTCVLVFVANRVITTTNLPDAVVIVCGTAAVVYFGMILLSVKITAVERSRVLSFIPLFAANVAFWSLYQQFTVVEIYTDGRVDKSFLGWEMPTEWVGSFVPVFVILLAPVFAALWTKLGPAQPPTPIKFALGNVMIGLAFASFLPWAGGAGPTTPLLALGIILLGFALGELMISPVGLSLATRISPMVFRSQMVALYFLSVALGTAMSGSLAGYYSLWHEERYFGVLGTAAIVAGLVLAGLSPVIRRLMAGVR